MTTDDCRFLTQSLQMTSIVFLIVRIYQNQFKWIYLRSQKNLPDFLLYSWKLHQIFHMLKKKMTLIVDVFPKLEAAQDLVRNMFKKTRI